MFDIGFSELCIIAIVALIILGPEKLPQAAKSAGRWYAKIRHAMTAIQTQMESELNIAETRRQMQEELDKIRQIESNMQKELDKICTKATTTTLDTNPTEIEDSDTKQTNPHRSTTPNE